MVTVKEMRWFLESLDLLVTDEIISLSQVPNVTLIK
jgi:hypothetical protein